MSAKRCPYCGARGSYWRRLTSGSPDFECAACGEKLKEDWKRILVMVFVIMWPVNWVLVQTDRDSRYLWGMAPAFGVVLLIDYLLLRVLPVEKKSK